MLLRGGERKKNKKSKKLKKKINKIIEKKFILQGKIAS